MTKVTIVCLIYRSARLADAVHESARRFTPMIDRGEAEFLFVANDPTAALVQHLEAKGYPHIVNVNTVYSDEDLYAAGYGTPEYMSRVYRGYNEGIRAARGDYVVLINSDNFFSPDWLENLLKYSDRGRVVTSLLVEREHPVHAVFPGAVHGEFGGSVDDYDEVGFLAFANRIRKSGLMPDGAYMPALMHRDVAIEAGLYPCGNVAGKRFDEVVRYGDEAFYDRLRGLGVEHVTALDSISYHLKEGEKDDVVGSSGESMTALAAGVTATPITPLPITPTIRAVTDRLVPTPDHLETTAFAGAGSRAGRKASVALDSAAEVVMHNQAMGLRRSVERVFGQRLGAVVLKGIHAVSWMVRPLRKKLIGRRLG